MNNTQSTTCVCVIIGVSGFAGLWTSASAVYAEGQTPGRYSVSDVAEYVTPSVVNITTRRKKQSFYTPTLSENESSQATTPPQVGTGSGVLISSQGDIVTNNHVVDGAQEIIVTLADNREFEASLIGADKPSDLAFIRIPTGNLPFLNLGDSSELRLGEFVIAVGNPFGVGQTVTLGIVSAKGRANVGILDYEDFIQTDAAINPGSSGGALVNLDSKLVGINTAVLARAGGAQGIGFAVPSNAVRAIHEQMIRHGQVKRGWLGIATRNLTTESAAKLKARNTRGVEVDQVFPSSPADKSGIRKNDVIVAINGRDIANFAQLRARIAFIRPGNQIELSLTRNGQSTHVSVVLEERKNFLPFPVIEHRATESQKKDIPYKRSNSTRLNRKLNKKTLNNIH